MAVTGKGSFKQIAYAPPLGKLSALSATSSDADGMSV